MLTAECSLHVLHSQTAREYVSCGVLLAQLLLSAIAEEELCACLCANTQATTDTWCRYSRKMTQADRESTVWVSLKSVEGPRFQADWTESGWFGANGLNFDPDAALRGWDLCVDRASQQYFIHWLLIMQLESWPLKGSLAAVLIRNLCKGCWYIFYRLQ